MKITHLSDAEYRVSDVRVDNLFEQRYCVFDFEATGPNPESDYITQIGAVVVDAACRTYRQYSTLVRPPKPIPEKIEKLTGIRNLDVRDAPCFAEVFDDFMKMAEGSVLVTQAGYEYDYWLMAEECRRNDIPLPELAMIDTKALFTFLYPEVSEVVSTDFLIRRFGVDDRDIQRHNALGDSLLIARLFGKLLEECRSRKINSIVFDSLNVKKVQLKPLD